MVVSRELMVFGTDSYQHSQLGFQYEKVVVVFVADFIQPLFCFLFLYQALVVHFGM